MVLREGFIFLLSHYLVLDLLTLLRCYPNRTVTLKVKGTVILLRDCSSESKMLNYNLALILNLKIARGGKSRCTLAVLSRLLLNL